MFYPKNLLTCSICLLAIIQLSAQPVDQYLSDYAEIVQSEMIRTGIPASIKLAQGMLESDFGRSDLATVANNHFGIKCGQAWDGGTYYKEDDEYHSDGKIKRSCFREFSSVQESFIAHSDFLAGPRKSKRYDFLFTLDTDDYKSWARGLKKSGYATDPYYPQKLIHIIEEYELHRYDINTSRESSIAEADGKSETIKRKPVNNNELSPVFAPRNKLNDRINGLRVIITEQKETPSSLAALYKVKLHKIIKYNEGIASKGDSLNAGTIVYLENKKKDFEGAKKFHTVKKGDDMYSISQKYGLKLSSLYQKNRLPQGSEPIAGEKILLRGNIKLIARPDFKSKREVMDDAEYLFAEGN